MTYTKHGTTITALVMLVALVALHFAPRSIKLLGELAIASSMVVMSLVDRRRSARPLVEAVRKAASCGCERAKKQVMNMPAVLESMCSTCGAELA